MLQSRWMRLGALVGLVAAITAGTARADDKDKDKSFGPIDSMSDVQDSLKILFKLADTNNDGQISQKEANDAGNLLVGGFFFSADANGDGVVTADEGRQARESLYARQPVLRYIVEKARWSQQQENRAGNNSGQAGAGAIRTLQSMIDSNSDQKIQASELRQMVQTSVQGMFAMTDTNRDGQLTPAELNSAVDSVARSAVQAAFQTADADRSGTISMGEYDKAIIGPSHALFRILDANNDNQISPDEMQRAEVVVADYLRRLKVPEPANSLRNRIDSGVTPASATSPAPAPVPAPAPAPGR